MNHPDLITRIRTEVDNWRKGKQGACRTMESLAELLEYFDKTALLERLAASVHAVDNAKRQANKVQP